MVEPDTVKEGQCYAIAIRVHNPCCQDIRIVFLVLCSEMLANHALVCLDVPDSNTVVLGLSKQDQWLGLAYAHTSLR